MGVARLFLARNGYSLKFDPHDGVQTIERLALWKTQQPRLADWFGQRTVKS
jgi:prophage maintenance system killer protein